MTHDLQWEPGTKGKGWLLADGSVWTWPVDESMRPFHMHKDYTIKKLNLPKAVSAFQIFEDGGIHRLGSPINPEELETIQKADSRLHDADRPNEWLLSSTQEEQWQPGQNGKGILLTDGIYTWPVDEGWEPNHEEHIERFADRPYLGALYIYSDGSFLLYTRNPQEKEDAEELVQQYDPRLKPKESVWDGDL